MWRRFKQWCQLTDWVNFFGVTIIVGIVLFVAISTGFMAYGAITAPPSCQ